MLIIYDEKNKIFHLIAKDTSYIMKFLKKSV